MFFPIQDELVYKLCNDAQLGAKTVMTPPVLYLIFNRPDLVEKSFARIRDARPSRLFIAADGPRKDREGEAKLCDQSRKVIESIDWKCDVQTLFRNENLGCREAVSTAITWFFDNVEEGIILEDDCVADPTFFSFCSEILEYYRSDERIMSICGESYGNEETWRNGNSYTFSGIPLIWGWATWRRAWKLYDIDLTLLDTADPEKWLTHHLGSSKAGKYWLAQLASARDGSCNTWDYQWFASNWRQSGLTIHPARNTITNIGCDDRGTHTFNPQWAMSNRCTLPLFGPLNHPENVARDYLYDKILLHERFGVFSDDTQEVTGREALRNIVSSVSCLVRRCFKRFFGNFSVVF